MNFRKLVARDVMNEDVLTVPEDWSAKQLAEFLSTFPQTLGEIDRLLTTNQIHIGRTQGRYPCLKTCYLASGQSELHSRWSNTNTGMTTVNRFQSAESARKGTAA